MTRQCRSYPCSLLVGVLLLCLSCLLAGCGTTQSLAPVGRTAKQAHKSSPQLSQTRATRATHVVRKGETLYSIAFAYGHDYRQLARWNGISPPYTIFVGQTLSLKAVNKREQRAKATVKSHKSSKKTTKQVSKPSKKPSTTVIGSNKPVLRWQWPTKGRLKQTFLKTDPTRKGIEISGRLGQGVTAAAAGKVVYSGSGLRGYGQLIIVKHNERFLSAYAHNRKLLVKEGVQVKQGQRIAEMGRSGADSVKLHFEIRRDGRPVDPLRYLPKI